MIGVIEIVGAIGTDITTVAEETTTAIEIGTMTDAEIMIVGEITMGEEDMRKVENLPRERTRKNVNPYPLKYQKKLGSPSSNMMTTGKMKNTSSGIGINLLKKSLGRNL